MSSWYKFLEEIIEKEELENYTNIYYLGSHSNLIEEYLLEEIINKNKITNFLMSNIVDNTKDSLDFFLFENRKIDKKELVIIYNPFELFQSPYIYKVVDFFNENKDFNYLPYYQKVK